MEPAPCEALGRELMDPFAIVIILFALLWLLAHNS